MSSSPKGCVAPFWNVTPWVFDLHWLLSLRLLQDTERGSETEICQKRIKFVKPAKEINKPSSPPSSPSSFSPPGDFIEHQLCVQHNCSYSTEQHRGGFCPHGAPILIEEQQWNNFRKHQINVLKEVRQSDMIGRSLGPQAGRKLR